MRPKQARNRLMRLRRAEGLSRAEVAALLGADEAELRRWESGEEPIPEAHRAPLARRFGVSTDWLLGVERFTAGSASRDGLGRPDRKGRFARSRNRLARLRRAEGMTREEVAALLRVDVATVAEWEERGTRIPDEHAARLALRFGTTLAWLAGEEELPTA